MLVGIRGVGGRNTAPADTGNLLAAIARAVPGGRTMMPIRPVVRHRARHRDGEVGIGHRRRESVPNQHLQPFRRAAAEDSFMGKPPWCTNSTTGSRESDRTFTSRQRYDSRSRPRSPAQRDPSCPCQVPSCGGNDGSFDHCDRAAATRCRAHIGFGDAALFHRADGWV